MFRNHLLNALVAAAGGELTPAAECIRVDAGETLHGAGASIRAVYFPAGATVAMLTTVEDGRTMGTALVAREGSIGISGVDGHRVCTPTVLTPGDVYRVDARALSRALARAGPATAALLGRYADLRLFESLEITACAAFHLVEPRLCTLLLRVHDQLGEECRTTQELLSMVLGARRATVTVAVRELDARDLIQARRGVIRVRDRFALEAAACGCYAVLRDHFERFARRPRRSGEGHVAHSTAGT